MRSFISIAFAAVFLFGCGGNTEQTAERLPAPGESVAVDEMPILKEMPPPEYTDAAREANEEGTIIVTALVGKDGRVIRVTVENPETLPHCNDAAVRAVQKAVFKPAVQNNKPVAVWVKIPISFKLDRSTATFDGGISVS